PSPTTATVARGAVADVGIGAEGLALIIRCSGRYLIKSSISVRLSRREISGTIRSTLVPTLQKFAHGRFEPWQKAVAGGNNE
ncbi:MAG: hypothetical protein WB760_30735, partial [Xanthobacteraceae bacterium]